MRPISAQRFGRLSDEKKASISSKRIEQMKKLAPKEFVRGPVRIVRHG